MKWLLTAALLSGAAFAQSGLALRAGSAPPPLLSDKLKGNCPAELAWPDLRGLSVAISFTSLADRIEDSTAQAAKFRGERILFVHVVHDSEFLIDQVLSRIPEPVCVILDSSGRNARALHIDERLDRTLYVDEFGYIAGYSRNGFDESAVRALLDHQTSPALSETLPGIRTPAAPKELDPAPSYEVHISSAAKDERKSLGDTGGRPDRYITKNQPLKLIMLDLWDTPLARIALPEDLDEKAYDVSAVLPVEDPELVRKLVREAVETHFGLQIDKEQRVQRVYVLKAAGRLSPQFQPAKVGEADMTSGGEGRISGTSQEMGDVAFILEDLLQIPVIDETGLKGRYDYSASSRLTGPDAVFEMARQLGLELVPYERPVEMLVVRKLY